MSSSRPGQEIRKLSEVNLRALRWVKSGKLESQLISEGQLVGTLRWTSRGGSLATAELADGVWMLKHVGLLKPRITIREVGSDLDLAVMPLGWRGEGYLRFARGQSFLVRCANFWQSQIAVFDSQGKRLIALRPDSRMSEEKGSVEIEKAALDNIPDIPLLAILSLYLALLLARQDNYAGTIAALIGAGAI